MQAGLRGAGEGTDDGWSNMADCSMISFAPSAHARQGADRRTVMRETPAVEESRRCSTGKPASPQNEVTVLFDNAAVTFPMPVGFTLADLATQVAKVDVSQRGRMVRVAVKLSRE
jgi:hypothetical protein